MQILFLLALIAFPFRQIAPPATATIQGKILRASTQEPLAGMQIVLLGGPNARLPLVAQAATGAVRVDFGEGQPVNVASIAGLLSISSVRFDSGAITTKTGMVTNADGSYVFRDLIPGRYTLLVQREGYFEPPRDGNAVSLLSRQFNVEGGKTVTEDFRLVKEGVISGRIQNPSGEPLVESLVVAGQWGYSGGQPVFLTTKGARTNDLGEYRLSYLMPGEYIVGTGPNPPDMAGSAQDTWNNVFYPGISDAKRAVALRLDEGQELASINIKLQEAPAASYNITGTILNLPAGEPDVVGYPELQIRPREPDPLYNIPISPLALSTASQVLRGSGEFLVRNVRPGFYDLLVYMMHSPPNRNVSWAGKAVVEVRNANVDGLQISLSRSFPITGTIVDKDNALGGIKKNLRISLETREPAAVLMVRLLGTFSVDDKGSFASPDIPAGHYGVTVAGLPPTAYVADIRYGAVSAFDDGIDIGRDPQPLEVVVAADGATVQGTVLSRGQPTPNVTVVLIPPESRRRNAALYKNVATDNNGTFKIQAVAPGNYTIFAWQNILPSAWQNADFVEKYRGQGKPVVAIRGGNVELELQMIP